MIYVKPFYYYDEVLSYLPNVQIIELQYTNCSDESMICIADHCHNLKSLDLNSCIKISDRGLIYLAEKKIPLESLNLKGTTVTYKGVASVLKNIPTIKTLLFNNVPRAIFEALGLNDAVVEIPEGKVFNLTNIIIVNKPMRPEAHLTSTLELCLSLCPFIEDLTVTEILNEKQLHLCSLFKELKAINLQCSLSSARQLYVNNFLEVRGNKIHTLTLMNFSLSVQVLVNCCPNLKQLTLEYPSFEVIPNMRFINKLNHLKILYLQNTELNSEENIKSISAIISVSPYLEELNFRVCQFVEEIYDDILHHPEHLKALGFGSTSVDAMFLENVLIKHKTLTELYLDNSGITTDEYDDLMDFVDTMDRTVNVKWSDYNEAIKELYSRDFEDSFISRTILKL